MFHRPGLLPPTCQQDGRTRLRRAAFREASWRPRAQTGAPDKASFHTGTSPGSGQGRGQGAWDCVCQGQ